ncbi:MAG: GNAT family N-acetyltransferase [Lachnospiraceae bacterium]|nr:GNAT family N-acetyltransferase [Lachnospiraceae bacterium]
MKKINKTNYIDYIEAARGCTANQVYPLSIVTGVQTGDIYADDGGNVLFWHYCGFAYISWNADPNFLEQVYREFLVADTERRFFLITDSDFVTNYYKNQQSLQFDKRLEYEHILISEKSSIPDKQFTIERITEDNIGCVRGRIVPTFSWENDKAFLENGFGYIVRKDAEFAAIAFSSAVSPEEVDIGVETAEVCRHHGLASCLASLMCEDIRAQGKTPVWAHAESNEGSQKTAISVGFKPCKVNTVIKKNTC